MAQAEPRRPALATGVLVAGAIAYGFLCFPAITCRGYPEIDPIWYGFTFAWPIAIVVSAYFDSSEFGGRGLSLIVYSFVTGFFFAGTLVIQVPRGPVNPLGMLLVGSLFLRTTASSGRIPGGVCRAGDLFAGAAVNTRDRRGEPKADVFALHGFVRCCLDQSLDRIADRLSLFRESLDDRFCAPAGGQ